MKTLTSNILKIKTDNGFVELPAIAGTVANDNISSQTTTWTSNQIINSKYTYTPKQIAPYLYYLEYEDWSPEKANNFFEQYKPSLISGCSSVRKGNFYGRNYDWLYDETPEFIVKMNPHDGRRHSSIGVAAAAMSFTLNQTNLYNGLHDNEYEILPYLTLDGINDAGVTCNINVVPPYDREWRLSSDSEDNMCALAVVRYILDYADSANHALELLESKHIYGTYGETFQENYHFMIADANDTYVVELLNGQIQVLEDSTIMTNFYLGYLDGSTYTPIESTATAYYKSEDFDADTTTLTDHSMGLERYDLLLDNYDNITDLDSMREEMLLVQYSKAYQSTTNPPWLSEFSNDYGENSYGDLTIYSTAADYQALYQAAQQSWPSRTRNGQYWHTVHCSVYDIANKQLNIWIQEQDTKYTFELGNTPKTDITLTDTVTGKHYKLIVANGALDVEEVI